MGPQEVVQDCSSCSPAQDGKNHLFIVSIWAMKIRLYIHIQNDSFFGLFFFRWHQPQKRWVIVTVCIWLKLGTRRWWFSNMVNYSVFLLCWPIIFVVTLRFNSMLPSTDKEDGAISTVVIRGSTDNLMDDIERAVDDGVNTFKLLVRVSQQRETLSWINELFFFTSRKQCLECCTC